VIVSDLRGVLPLHEGHLPAIMDARRRLLAPGGVLIPRRDVVWAAVVEAPELYERFSPLEVHGVSLDAARRLTSNLWTKAHLGAGAPVTDARQWATLDYRTVTAPNVRGTLGWTVSRDAEAHGLCLWFDAELADGIGYSGAPGAPELVYGQGFFPFPDPVGVRAGDRVKTDLRADLVNGEYVWTWNTEVLPTRGDPRSFRQTTLRGALLSLEDLRGMGR
jgi:protein arginine N-methyltransferase 1